MSGPVIVNNRDNNNGLLLGIVLILALVVVVGNLLADVAYAFMDPRIRYSAD